MIPERLVSIPSGAGRTLQGALGLPPAAGGGVVLCHPHPLYGGDMDNPIVVTAARACASRGLATLRFNFRGVGQSAGDWDEGRGEQDDVRAALAHLADYLPAPHRIALAGYSFGAAMAAAVAAHGQALAGLALIAPPLAFPGWKRPDALPMDGPLLVVAGSEDTYCSGEALAVLARALPAATVTVIDGADHFFFAGQEALATALADWAVKLPGRTP